MKRIILSVLLLSVTVLFAQDQKSLEERAKKMVELTTAGQYEALMDYTHPGLFDIVPKESLIQAMRSMLDTDTFKVSILPTPPNFKFGPITKIDKAHYSIIEHDMVMQLTFKEPMEDEDMEMMQDILKGAMKSEEVKYNTGTKAFSIKKRTKMIAIADEKTKNQWMYLNYDNSNKMIDRLIPENAIKQLGLNNQ